MKKLAMGSSASIDHPLSDSNMTDHQETQDSIDSQIDNLEKESSVSCSSAK